MAHLNAIVVSFQTAWASFLARLLMDSERFVVLVAGSHRTFSGGPSGFTEFYRVFDSCPIPWQPKIESKPKQFPFYCLEKLRVFLWEDGLIGDRRTGPTSWLEGFLLHLWILFDIINRKAKRDMMTFRWLFKSQCGLQKMIPSTAFSVAGSRQTNVDAIV